MHRLLPLTLAALMFAPPVLAGGIVVDMPNLTFPDGKPTLSTKGCEPSPEQACPVRS